MHFSKYKYLDNIFVTSHSKHMFLTLYFSVNFYRNYNVRDLSDQILYLLLKNQPIKQNPNKQTKQAAWVQ